MLNVVVLLAALFTALNAEKEVTMTKLPNGFPDGTLITFFFYHKGDINEPYGTSINFYDVPSVETKYVLNDWHDISAHLRIERHLKPVVSNTLVNGEWRQEIQEDQTLDEMPPNDGWWRVDVYKHDKWSLRVFFQGFSSGVRTFDKSLDDVKSIYIFKQVDHSRIHIRQSVAHRLSPARSIAQFAVLCKDVSRDMLHYEWLPIGAYIELAVLMPASGENIQRVPAVAFKRNDDEKPFMRIFQKWEEDRQAMYISSSGKRIICTNEKPNGDLQHLKLTRISQSTIRVQVFYKPGNRKSGFTCEHTLQADIANYFDNSFDLWVHDGAVIMNLRFLKYRTKVSV